MKLPAQVNCTLEVQRDAYGLFWHVTVTRVSDGMRAWTTTASKPDLSTPAVQTLIKALSHN